MVMASGPDRDCLLIVLQLLVSIYKATDQDEKVKFCRALDDKMLLVGQLLVSLASGRVLVIGRARGHCNTSSHANHVQAGYDGQQAAE